MFRDFGILPDGLQPPPEKIRAFFSTGTIVGQYIGTAIAAALGLAMMVLFALYLPLPLSFLGCAAALTGCGAFVYLATHHDYRWVELEGNTLRAKHLYTGCTIERAVEEIESLSTMTTVNQGAGTIFIEKLLGRVKGVEIRFRDRRTPLRILRTDPAMTNAKELIEAVLYRMAQVRELEAEIVDFRGKPLTRKIHWKGVQPSVSPWNNVKIIIQSLMILSLSCGAILSYWGLQEQERHLVGSLPPHEIALHSLIQNGPGTNRHVTITDFRPGGYTVETQHDSWRNVWVALFPTGAPLAEAKEIKVVLSSKDIGDEADLRRLLQPGRVTGICSRAPTSSWGMTLGPRLVQANPGCQLSSAWSIEALRDPPSAALVAGIFNGSAGCFAATFILATIVFWKAH